MAEKFSSLLRLLCAVRVLRRMWYDSSLIVGVGSPNSNNEFIKETLDWEPTMVLEDDGTRVTGQRIRKEGEMTLEGY